MNSKISSEWMKKQYGQTADQYRRNDELHVTGEDHARICDLLRSVCLRFHRPIKALEVGCGTGRYFHCLRSCEKLLGVDASPEMLEHAKNPVRKEMLDCAAIELVAGNFYELSFDAGSFDVIYAVGVFGNGCRLDQDILRKFHQWLTPGGMLFFDVEDVACLSLSLRIRVRLRALIYTLLSDGWQQKWVRRRGWLPFFAMSKKETERALAKANFKVLQLNSVECYLTNGKGRKLEVLVHR